MAAPGDFTTLDASSIVSFASGAQVGYLWQCTNAVSGAGNWVTLPSVSGSGALTVSSADTNLTVSLGGTPTTALLAAASIGVNWAGLLSVTRGGTGLNTCAAGDIPYASAIDTLAMLPANATATRKFLMSQSSGAPVWDVLQGSDIGNIITQFSSAGFGIAAQTNSYIATSNRTAIVGDNYQLNVGGTYTGISGTTNIIDLNIVRTHTSGTGGILLSAGIQITPNTNATTAAITTSYGMLINAGVNTAGTVTTSYGAYITAPGFGTTKVALWTNDVTIGTATAYSLLAMDSNKNVVSIAPYSGGSSTYVLTWNGATTAPTWQAPSGGGGGGLPSVTGTANQILINGVTTIQTTASTFTLPTAIIAPGSIQSTTTMAIMSAITATDGLLNAFAFTGAAGAYYGYNSTGTISITSGTAAQTAGVNITNVINCNAGTVTIGSGIINNPTLSNTSGTYTSAYAYYSKPTATATATIGTYATQYLDTPTSSGTITTAYTAYYAAPPTAGTSSVAVWAHSLQIGGTILAGNAASGNVNFGAAGIGASSLLATDGSKNLTTTVSGLSPTFTGLTLSGLTSTLIWANGSNVLAAVTLSANFAAGFAGTLDTVQGIQTSSSPTFTGLTLSGPTASTLTYFNGSKALSSVTLGAGANLTLSAGTLDTAQGITTSSNPQFNSLGVGVAASGTAGYIQANARIGIAMAPSYPLDVTGNARFSTYVGIGNATPGTYMLDVTGNARFTTTVGIAGATPSANVGFGNSFTLANTAGTSSYGEYNASSITATSGTTSIIASLGINSTIVNSPATTTTTVAGILITPAITNSTASSFITNPTGIYLKPTFTGTVTLTNVYGELIDTITSGGGTLTNAYGSYIKVPTAGTTNVALYADDMAIGTAATVPPTNGLLVLGSIKNTALTVSSLVATDGSKNLTSTTSGLSPTFTGLTLSGLTSTLIWANGSNVLAAVTLSANFAGAFAGTLDTVQGIQTSSNPQFNSLGVGVASSGTAGSIYANNSLGVGVTPPATAGYAQINARLGIAMAPSYPLDVTGNARFSTYVSIGNATPGTYMLDVTGNARITTTLGINGAVPSVNSSAEIGTTFTATAIAAYGINLTGTITGQASAAAPTLYGISITSILKSGATQTGTVTHAGVNIVPAFDATSTTITNAYAIYGKIGTVTSTVTNASSGYFDAPAGGSNRVALWADSLQIGGTLATGTAASGNVNFGAAGISASALLATDGSKNLTTTVSGLSPTFTGLTLSGLTSTLIWANGSNVLAAVTLSANFAGAFAGTLDTVQGIQTSSTPQFSALGIGVAAAGTAGTIYANVGLGVGVTPPTTAGYAQINARLGIAMAPSYPLDITGNARFSTYVGIGNATPGTYMLDVTGNTRITTSLGVGTTPPAGAGDVNINSSLGVGVAAGGTAGTIYANVGLGVGVTPPTTAGYAQINARLGLASAPSATSGFINNISFTGAAASYYAEQITSSFTYSSGSITQSGVIFIDGTAANITTTGATISAFASGIINNAKIINTSGTLTAAYGYYSLPTFTGTTTIGTVASLYLNTPAMSGTITSAYGIYNSVPVGAGQNYGYYQTGTFTKANDIGFQLNNTFTPGATATNYAFLNNPSMVIGSGTVAMTNFYTNHNSPTINVTSATGAITFIGFYGINVTPSTVTLSGAAHVLQTYYGIYSASPSPTLANGATITTAYSGYFAAPGIGTTAIALYAANMAIGTAGVLPPTNGLLVAGIIKNTNLTLSRLVYTDASQQLASVTLAANLTLTTGTLDTVQGIQTSSTPQFAGLGIAAAANTAAYGIVNSYANASVATSFYYAYYSNGAVTIATANTNDNLCGAYFGNTFTTNHASAILNTANSIYSKPIFTNTTGQFNYARNLFLDRPTITGSILIAYGVYNNVPVGGTSNYGYYQTGTFTKVADIGLYLNNTFTPTTDSGTMYQSYMNPTFNTTTNTISSAFTLSLAPTFTVAGAFALNNAYGIDVFVTDTINAAATLGASYGIRIGTTASGTNATAIGNAYNLYLNGMTVSGSAVITNGIGIYNSVPVGAATNYGYYQTGTFTKATDIGMRIANTFTPTADGGTLYQIYTAPAFNTTTNTITHAYAAQIAPTFTVAGAFALTNAYGLDVAVIDTINAAATLGASYGIRIGTTAGGTSATAITNAYNLYLNGMTTSGSAVISTGYGIYNSVPVGAATNYGYYSIGTFTKGTDTGMRLSNTFTPTTDNASVYQLFCNPTFNTTTNTISNARAVAITPTFTVAGAFAMNGAYAMEIVNTNTINAAATLSNSYCLRIGTVANGSSATAISNAYNLYLNGMTTSGSAVITTGYGIYNSVPVGAATNYGYYQTGTFTKTNERGMVLSNTFTPAADAGTLIQFMLQTTFNTTTNSISSAYGTYLLPTFNTSAASITTAYANYIGPTFTISGVAAMSTIHCCFINPTINITTATTGVAVTNIYGINVTPLAPTITTSGTTATNYYGIYCGTMPTKTGAGNFTNVYGGYFATPTTTAPVTLNIALWANDITIGTATTFAPLAVDTNKNVVSLTSGMSNVGYVLTSTGSSSVPTWQVGGAGGGVPSVTGTANQILINGGTSAVTTASTFTLPSTLVAPGTIQATTSIGIVGAAPTTSGLFNNWAFSGAGGTNQSITNSAGSLSFSSATTSIAASLLINTAIGTTGTADITTAAGIYNQTSFTSNSSAATSKFYGMYNNITLTNTQASDQFYIDYNNAAITLTANISAFYGSYMNGTVSSGAGTLTTMYGLYVDALTKSSGVVTTAYGAYITNPTAGTTNIALYATNANLNYAGVAPPTGGMIMSGKLGVGNNNPTNQLEVTGKARFSDSVICATGALATTATDGYVYIPTCAGIPTGVPTSQTGTCAMAYDTTNNDLYIYDGTWQKSTLNAAGASDTFETVNANNSCYPYAIVYDGSDRYSTVTYTTGGGNIVKTFSYNGDGTINTIVLSGAGLPVLTYTTKTYTYTTGVLTSVAYS